MAYNQKTFELNTGSKIPALVSASVQASWKLYLTIARALEHGKQPREVFLKASYPNFSNNL
jgi:hypothetical protein